MSVIIIGSGGGRATLRRIDAKQYDPALKNPFTAARAQQYNDLLTTLASMADADNCPPDPCPE